MDRKSFFSRFRFAPLLSGAIGVEREFFLTDTAGAPVPRAEAFLAEQRAQLTWATGSDKVADDAWTYELSACQVEHRTEPCITETQLASELAHGTAEGRRVAEAIDCRLSAMAVAPENMPLAVYPDDRYLAIAERIPTDTLRAACRVAGVHVHLGMGSIDEAIEVHARLCRHLDLLCKVGDVTGGERLRIYKRMAQKWSPHAYDAPTLSKRKERFYRTAVDEGFAENLRNCWHLIRISPHGTVELRMFDMTDHEEDILRFAWLAKKIAFG